ncbi:MAG: hypothetical protein ABJF10_22845 [Chthoniobacter sp.]|uniref:hypothetical protein n=1 Tax=Chthoniobacter sp. TaxID=2510640 RepID=UPI0032A3D166
MSPENISAERDALLKALNLAEQEIAKARAAQQRAEAKVAEVNAQLALRAKSAAQQDAGSAAVAQAQTAQKRAEAKAQLLEAQLRGKQMELDALEGAADELRNENEQLRCQIEEKAVEVQEMEAALRVQEDLMAPLQKDAEEAKAEVRRLRSIVMQVTTGTENPVATAPKARSDAKGAVRAA